MAKSLVKALTLITISAVALPGCATVVRGTKTDTTFQSGPSGARVTVTSTSSQKEGPFSCRTPCTLNLKRKRTWLVRYEMNGYKPVEAYLDSRLSGAGMGWTAGSLVGAGVIGAGIDIGTGATQKLTPNPMIARLELVTSQNESMVMDAQFEPVAVAQNSAAQPAFQAYPASATTPAPSQPASQATTYSFTPRPTTNAEPKEKRRITWP